MPTSAVTQLHCPVKNVLVQKVLSLGEKKNGQDSLEFFTTILGVGHASQNKVRQVEQTKQQWFKLDWNS